MENFSPNAEIEVLEVIDVFFGSNPEKRVIIPAGILQAQLKGEIVSFKDCPITFLRTDKRIKVLSTKN